MTIHQADLVWLQKQLAKGAISKQRYFELRARIVEQEEQKKEKLGKNR